MSTTYLGTRESLPPDLQHSRGLVCQRAAKCLLLPCGLFSAGVFLATGSPTIALLTGWVGALPLLANRRYNLRDLGGEVLHALTGHRFLCPGCLHFGEFAAARQGEAAGRPACGVCGLTCESDFYHARRVRVVGVLSASALDEFLPPTPEPTFRDAAAACYDDTQYLHYYLDLNRFPEPARRLPSHALNDIDTIWIDPRLRGPELDAAVRRGQRLCGRATEELTAWIGPTPPSPGVLGALSTRFRSVLTGNATFPVFPGLECGRAS